MYSGSCAFDEGSINEVQCLSTLFMLFTLSATHYKENLMNYLICEMSF